ncbi:TIGR03885 family FMN-dependent LLM class oxidoreductase [Devosia sp. Leaf64]|uniref:TIGR03885 family FMN-dependent LLM class oxidoreductase n=1 Tax=Devosia sp. Leaf64 TaxID=1736229 RepID=UPI0007130663|nr:TIGR03885 family FMN-dependent LLM class oxidoreductase [Devosia sp. Leaf64]KQN71335.1 LLM class F420-dependent oxidoreductase [Devosia sp. Leaf64]
MTNLGYHASHEQFAPSVLLQLLSLAEASGFDCGKSSDHFHPWSERQGQSGFVWSWLGAAMQATKLPMGVISAPGYRYHPAVLAQAAATIGEMYPDRLWLSLGTGEAINEAITGMYWPDKHERNSILLECVDVIRALFLGETVTHRGRVTVIEAKLYSRPSTPVPLVGAAMTQKTARWCGSWADGLLTSGGRVDVVRPLIEAFYEGGGEGKPVYLQTAVSWAPTRGEALGQALDQWSAAAVGGEVNWDLRRPADFDLAGRLVREDDICQIVNVSHEVNQHLDWLAGLMELDLDSIFLHQVGRNQHQFIEVFGSRVLPAPR